jgi:ATP-dependent RNA helicase DDX19/DBP5
VKIQSAFDDQKLQQLQENEASPLFALSTFEELGLQEELLKGIRMMGWKKPSKIQCVTLPHVLQSNENVIGQSQSGTGKTGCFGLGLLSRVDLRLKRPQALVIAPTRELAKQITDEIRRMAKYIPSMKIITCIPGYDFTAGILAQVVIGTPGRVKDAIDRNCFDLSHIRVLVLDEADNMLMDKQRGKSGGLAAMAMQIKKRCPPNVQILLFSATYPATVRQFCMSFAPQAKKFSITEQKSLNLAYIKQCFVMVSDDNAKFEFLINVYGFCDINQSVIFVNTREAARNLAERMRAQKYSVALLQAEMPPEQRDQVVESFRSQMSRVLIATNVISRGLDVPMVSVVVNYEMPFTREKEPDYETYIHRIGRCGRFGRPGVAINLVSSQYDALALDKIADHYEIEMREVNDPAAFSDVFDSVEEETVPEEEQDGGYPPEEEACAPPAEQAYTAPPEEHAYAPPPVEPAYAPPPEEEAYAPAPEEEAYAPPPEEEAYAPPPEEEAYAHPPEEFVTAVEPPVEQTPELAPEPTPEAAPEAAASEEPQA